MPSNIQENFPVAFSMLEKVPDKLECHARTWSHSDGTEQLNG